MVIHRCRICGQLKVHVSALDEWNNWASHELPDTCDDCKTRMNSLEKENDILGGGIKLILDKYYKRDIKICFTYKKEKYESYYTIMMAPSRAWMEERLKESKVEMENAGLKKIDIKMMGDFSEMEDYEITSYMNDQETTKMRHLVSHGPNIDLCLPLMLKNYAHARGKSKDLMTLISIYLKIFYLLFHLLLAVLCIVIMYHDVTNDTINWKTLLVCPILFVSLWNAYDSFASLIKK